MATHHFTPSHYHRTIGEHEPVLHIADGDTVNTSTVDAHGMDASETQVTEGGNPMTGPFYVDGAEPGDALVVELEELTPNREYGWSRVTVAPNVLDPEYVARLPADDRDGISRWQIDAFGGTATMVEAPGTSATGLTLPLAPMVGCFGVAPGAGQAYSTATAGAYGGNMDYRGFIAGVSAVFPVFVPGALFHIGDGHALQGDGEIVGTGVEISFDVRFRVRLKKGAGPRWPGGENELDIFTVGNARPLDQALQHATTEMLRLLREEYGFDETGAQVLMGQAVRYEVANVFDPAYTVVCKMAKELVAG